MAQVALLKCKTYELSVVKEALSAGLRLLGGPKQFVRAGEKILLKPNILIGEKKEKATTTHPIVFRAAAEIFKEAGVSLGYGDSPGFGSPAAALKKCGLADHAQELGIELADFVTGKDIFFENGHQNKKFKIVQGVIDSDGLISLPKFKTHGLEKMTGAVKNQFGCVPGLRKAEYHVKLPDANDFAAMLLDLNACIKPRLYIMDGIMAMEGNGPRGGEPFPMHVLLLSADPVALDIVMCQLADLDPALVPTIKMGQGRFGYVSTLDDVEILGSPLASSRRTEFKVDRSPLKPYKARGSLRLLNDLLIPRPYILEESCVKCGVCVKVCPLKGKALRQPDKKETPVYDYNYCIRCFCCQEMCPEKAIMIREPFIRKISGKLRKLFNFRRS